MTKLWQFFWLAFRARYFRIRDEIHARKLYRKYRHATMVTPDDFRANIRVAKFVLAGPELREAAIIECGTWRGGMSAVLCEIGGPGRQYFFFDSFEGLPPAKEIDGERAIAYQADKSGPFYHSNATASFAEFEDTISRSGIPKNRIHIFKGLPIRSLTSTLQR
jgi:O-methyltransferase